MQPYFFPYLGYFHLLHAVDLFVFYNDVNYIKSGWINRNKILLNKEELYFTVPLSKSSSFKNINKIELKKPEYDFWKKKFFKSIDQGYINAPFYSEVRQILTNVLNDPGDTISDLSKKSIISVLNYLEINKNTIDSKAFNNSELKSVDRIIDICKETGAKEYINLIGGKELYNYKEFEQYNIRLKFISSDDVTYKQTGGNFVSNLSIIDVLMHNSRLEVGKLIKEYSLV